MNLANQLTLARILLTFICIGFIKQNNFSGLFFAFIVFVLAAVTDFFDGFIARKKNLISDLGKILDPIADKVLILGVFLAFIEIKVVNAWMVSAIMLREFIITGVRLYELNKGVVLEAKMFGKHKTFSQIAGIIFIFIILILAKTFSFPLIIFLYNQGIPAVMWYIVMITAGSGIHYLWVNRKIIKTF
jgi:CDP-diacylglycerol--glycerol-3-phosphate 3-phosphatidyltransferase